MFLNLLKTIFTISSFSVKKWDQIIKACVRFTEFQLIKSLQHQNVGQCQDISKLLTATTGQLINPYASITHSKPPTIKKQQQQQQQQKLKTKRKENNLT